MTFPDTITLPDANRELINTKALGSVGDSVSWRRKQIPNQRIESNDYSVGAMRQFDNPRENARFKNSQSDVACDIHALIVNTDRGEATPRNFGQHRIADFAALPLS